jgi:glycosyltransferase involved in cell wall biosynthesis
LKRLAIVSTHPIQYNAPWFQLLAQRGQVELKVFYTWSQAKETVKDKTFGKDIKWDIPLIEGYAYEFVENIAKRPGSHHFFGIDCPALIPKIKEFDPDAILVFGWKFKSHLRLLRHFKGKVPVWFRGDSTLLDEQSGFKTILRRQVLRWVFQHVDKAFYVGSANNDYFLEHGLKEKQLTYTPHAIDNGRFGDDSSKNYELQANEWRERLGFKDQDLVVVFAGKFESKKQPELLIDAIIAANGIRKYPIKLLLVGDGPLEDQLKKKAKSYDFITFISFQNQSQMPIVYRIGNVFCLPSKGPNETWGLAVNEAMASNRPVIVSNRVGCFKDLVINGKNGYVFKFNEIEHLIKILTELNLPKVQEMGKNAKCHIRNFRFLEITKSIEVEMENFKSDKPI